MNAWLSPIVCEPAALRREATKRRKAYQEESVSKGAAADYAAQGWEIVHEHKRKTTLRRQWPHDQRLENRVWHLLSLLGYPELSSGRNFKVKIERKGAQPFWKQIDVLAKDEETVVVVECKSCAERTHRSVQKDIEEFSSLTGPIASAVRKYYGSRPKLKFIWLFVTNNIVWSDPDKERAKGLRINVITEKELEYYERIAKHLRTAGRFQFLAVFLKDQKIPGMENVRVPAMKGKLGEHTFYSFVSTPKQMLKIAFVNHRTLNDPEGAPTYQRLVSLPRLHQIARFLQDGNFFATNILVNFTQECRFEQIAADDDTKVAFGHLYLPNQYRSAWVIDGQHRLYGYAHASDRELEQNIMVVAFESLSKTKQADLFVTINSKQKSVPKTLLDDLEGDLKWGSTRPAERIGAVGAKLINLLNNEIGPLYGRVRQEGIPATEMICLTVPELKRGLCSSGLVGAAILGGKEYAPGPLCGVTDSATLARARAVLNSYFENLAGANPKLWELGKQGHVCTNTALRAHFQLLGALIRYAESKAGLVARELEPLDLVADVADYLAPVLRWLHNVSASQMTEQFKVPFGSGGPRVYYFRLCGLVHEQFEDFNPEGFLEWSEAQSQERIGEADRQLKAINGLVQKFIFDKFKEIYKELYWSKGVLDREIQIKAFGRHLDDERRLPLENYLDFIEYKKIVENKVHWQLFKAVFDIPERGRKGHSKNLKWMEHINELRRIPAHATESRSYRVEDFEYIDYVFDQLTRRLGAPEGESAQGVAS